ncbi:response regulator transcription factor [Citromicrobium bathyomarinum]
MKLLLVEDDRVAASHVSDALASSGWRTDIAADGMEGLNAALNYDYDAIVLDRLLPELDGLSVLKSLRAAGRKTPVIMLTAIGATDDRIEGLRAGADDYLPKPFSLSELEARLEALVRRPSTTAQATALRCGNLELDLLARRVRRSGQDLDLLPKEFALLEELMRAEGRVLSKAMLLERVWDFNFDPNSTVVETHVSRLRAKVDKPFDTPLIHTIKNVGYVLRSE